MLIIPSAIFVWQLFAEQKPLVRQLENATSVTSRCSELVCADTSHANHFLEMLKQRYGFIFRASSFGLQRVLQTLLARWEPQSSISATCKRSTARCSRGTEATFGCGSVSRGFEQQFALLLYLRGL